MEKLVTISNYVINILNWFGKFIPQLGIRLLLAYEFWESGVEKFNGQNWFTDIKDDFPFPFYVIPTDISWFLATWFELVGAVALILGLGTRFFSLSLIILDVIAWVSLHAGNGYNVCSNGYKLPLLYLILFLPLLFNGPGKVSIDHLIARALNRG